MWQHGIFLGLAAFLVIAILSLPPSIADIPPEGDPCEFDSDCGDPDCWDCVDFKCHYDLGATCVAEVTCDGLCKFIETEGVCEGACIPVPSHTGHWTDWTWNGAYPYIDPDTCPPPPDDPHHPERYPYVGTPPWPCVDVDDPTQFFNGYCDEYGVPHHGVCPDDWHFIVYDVSNPVQCTRGQYYNAHCLQYVKRSWIEEENIKNCPAYQICDSDEKGCVFGLCDTNLACINNKYYSGKTCDGNGGCTLGYGTALDPDYSPASCDCYFTPNRWNVGGDSPTADACCDGDTGEYFRMKLCEAGGCSKDLSDDACCDNADDCVYNSVCRPDGFDATIDGADVTCYSGVWRISPPEFVIEDSDGTDLAKIKGDGYMWIKGELKETFSSPSGTDNFIIQDSGENPVFWVDGSNGDVYYDGDLYETATGDNPDISGNFVVEDASGNAVAWITDGGDIYLKGSLSCDGELLPADMPQCGVDMYNNCGGYVTKKCGSNQHCVSGDCVCDTGYEDCEGTCDCNLGGCCYVIHYGYKCVDFDTDPDHCGSCDNDCPADGYCDNGKCDCGSDWDDCDNDGVCECDLSTHHCVGLSCEECFLPGTKISMADGSLKKIEDVESGDVVLSYNEETGEITQSVVEQLLVHTKENRKVPKDGYYVLATADGQEVKVTGIHLLYSMIDGSEMYESVQNLEEGDFVMVSAGNTVKWSKIVSLTFQKEELETLYNLELPSPNNYFADGILAHNVKPIPK
jgi:hypothetical protein